MPRLQKTLSDYLVIAITPALIMTLIGSLAFFLITVFYDGPFIGRLHFICALFIMATVLIGRISIMDGSSQALMYSTPLALAAMLAVTTLVEPQSESLRELGGIINVGLLAIIWWSAHKLTWDCTWIDEHTNAGGEGLLGNLGLDVIHQSDDSENSVEMLSYRPGEQEPGRNWWQRLTQRRQRAHAPGLWVVYFSLAALPLFGLGQWFLRDRDEAIQSYAFLLLAIYVLSGLGLLLTTSFLGMRRYLRQRNVRMPMDMAATWLGAGCTLIVLMLLFCLLLPRPGKPSVFSQAAQLWQSSDDLEASRQGLGNDGIDGESQGPGQTPSEQSSQDGTPEDKGAQGANEADNPSNHSGNTTSDGSAPAGGPSGQSDASATGQQAGKQGTSQSSSNDPGTPGQQGSSADDSSAGQPDNGSDSKESEEAAPPPSNTWLPKHLAEQFPLLLKILFYAILLVVGCYLLFRYRQELLVAFKKFIDELRSFWRWLRGNRRSAKQASSAATDTTTARVYPAFASYRNPFQARTADEWSTEQLICYSFDALEAWAREQGQPRQDHETPREFTRLLGKQRDRLAPSLHRIGNLYSQVAYAPGQISSSCVEDLRKFWQVLPAPSTSAATTPSSSSPSST